jgi:hypothetical protein
MTDKEAMKLALEALETLMIERGSVYEKAIAALKEALAQPAQRTWVGLTDEVITKVVDSMPRGIKGWMSDWDLYDYARAIEAKLKEKDT